MLEGLPPVTLGELYSLIGERDVVIYQQGKELNNLREGLKATTAEKEAKDPFKKDK